MKPIYRYLSIILCLCLLPFAGCSSEEKGTSKEDSASQQLAAAQYPQQFSYPSYENYATYTEYQKAYDEWNTQQREKRQLATQSNVPDDFLRHSVQEILSKDSEGNIAYSPINVYMALSLLAETASGESRAQILRLLGQEDIKALRTQTAQLWQANYRDDGAADTTLANALFLDDGYEYEQATLRNAAQYHYADIFSGKMGQASYDKVIADWLNDKTHDLLSEQTERVRTEEGDDMMLLSTVYFRAKWHSVFNAAFNTNDIFHAETGDRTVEFMHQESYSMPYYQSDNYTAVCRYFEEGGSMWLIRPNDGVDVMDVAADEKLLDPILSADHTDFHHPKVILSLPKFDIVSSGDLKEPLKALGVTDIFESGKADFSALTGKKDAAFLRSVQHDVRVMIDEEGCTATAFTAMPLAGSSAPPPEEVEFTLDRPFIFLITSDTGALLFAGVVQQP